MPKFKFFFVLFSLLLPLLYLPKGVLAVGVQNCLLNPKVLTMSETTLYKIETAQGGFATTYTLKIKGPNLDSSELVTLNPAQTFQKTLGPYQYAGKYSVEMQQQNSSSTICSESFEVTDNQTPGGSGLKIGLQNQNPTDQDVIKISYEGMAANQCAAIYVKTENNYIRPTGTSIGGGCDKFSDYDSYGSVQAINAKGELFVEAQPNGTYEIYVKRYEKSCDVLQNCQWNIQERSNTLRFNINPSQSTYILSLDITPASGKPSDNFTAKANLLQGTSPVSGQNIHLDSINGSLGNQNTDSEGQAVFTFNFMGVPVLQSGQHSVPVDADFSVGGKTIRARKVLTIGVNTTNGSTPTPGPTSTAAGTACNSKNGKLARTEKQGDQVVYIDTDNNIVANQDLGVSTAIGCVPTNPTELIKGLLKIATGAGGAIALLLMVAGVFKIITSSGNPDALKSGQEQITNAVIGLLFIIFSVLLLQIIGVNILGIAGLN